MQYAKTLSRAEMKEIKAGGGPCQVYVEDPDIGGYWSECVSVQEAQSDYNYGVDGATIGGYCCHSCGSGRFANADQNCS